jgi:GH25 family lysozyme M1 (1,4-beta-N-acetylmuramidase)
MNFDDYGIIGFDVSFYQDNNETPEQINFNKMKSFGASFVIIKAGQGTFKDPDFDYNWRESKLAGLPRGAYWFLDHSISGTTQAQACWNLLKNDLPEGIIFVDFEKDLQGNYPSWNEVYNFLVELMRLSGLPANKVGIYTGYFFWREHSPINVSQLNWFTQFPLWLAWYTDNVANVVVPAPWAECILWQDGTPVVGLQAGVESLEIDHNRFNGDTYKFKIIFGSSPVTPPGGNMTTLYNADLLAGKTSNVRNSPSTSGTINLQLVGPLTVNIISEKTTAGGYDWYQISSGWIALTSSYVNFRPATSSTEDKPVKITIEMESGKVYETTDFTQL